MGVVETEALRSGPLDPEDAVALPAPPLVQLAPLPQLLRFNQRQIEFVFGARRRLGDVFAIRTPEPVPLVITSLPDDVRSLFTAKPEEAPSLAASREALAEADDAWIVGGAVRDALLDEPVRDADLAVPAGAERPLHLRARLLRPARQRGLRAQRQ